MRVALVALALTLGGCALSYAPLAPEQITAMGRVKNATTLCVQATTPWGNVNTVVTSAGEGAQLVTESSVDASCKSATSTGRPTPAK
ncbi:MAG TPA: hypothetical protein VGT02_13190 [Methylomirabilota bacterium]|jgi:hypothetical protein|nr:hypothetical protein [Methylomirabilota bacterium]